MVVGEAFAKVLKAQRLKAGLTQEDLAELSDLSTRYISLLECNSQQPTLGYIHVLANALGISMSQLMQAVEKELHSTSKSKDSHSDG